MVTRKFCDLCKEEMSDIDREYFISFGEASNIPLISNSRARKGKICRDCCMKIEVFIKGLKK